LLGARTLSTLYLRSYLIEHRFYLHYAPNQVKGLRVPVVFYNFEDAFNARFGMIMQDLSGLDDGQPDAAPSTTVSPLSTTDVQNATASPMMADVLTDGASPPAIRHRAAGGTATLYGIVIGWKDLRGKDA